jgi:hypothetical protein
MLYDAQGNPIQTGVGRYSGMRVEALALPDGGTISRKNTIELHNKIKDSADLKEKFAAADRVSYEIRKAAWVKGGQVGAEPKFEETEHLALIRNDLSAETKLKQSIILDKNTVLAESKISKVA